MEIIKAIKSNICADMKWPLLPFICFCLSFFIMGLKPLPQFPALPEYQVKAVFLYNFSQFVQWPDSALADNGAPFVIGVLGKYPFGPYLNETIKNEKLHNHPFKIKHYEEIEDVEDCHILFITERNKGKVEEILNRLKGRSILTVGETKKFGQMGGIITFVKEEGKIKLKINKESADKAHLKISSKLLSLAKIVSTEEVNHESE